MATQPEWFRNTDWNEAIEEAFFKKLARARDKQQYLKIQAGMLASTHPEVALRLLDQYFAMGENLFIAEAWVAKANAFVALNEMGGAVDAFEAALARRDSYGKVFTSAYLNYPYLIATRRMVSLYDRALEVLELSRGDLVLPAQTFKRYGVRAVILAELGRQGEAREAARLALDAAAKTHSGLRYHPTVGLVGDENDMLRSRLDDLLKSDPPAPLASRVKAWFGRS